MGFMCKQCNEPTPYELMSKSPGVCRDCYIIGDMDRFREYDIPQSLTGELSHTQEESSPEPSPEKLSEHTMISVLLRLLQESEDQEIRGVLVQSFAVALGKSKPELELQLSLLSADRAGK